MTIPAVGFWGALQKATAPPPSVVTVIKIDKTTWSNTTNGKQVTLTSQPQIGDVIALLYVGTNTATPTAVTGCGATWDVTNKKGLSSTTYSHWIVIGTAATSTGLITMSVDTALGRTAFLHAYLIRGLGGVASMTYNQTNGYTTALTGPSQVLGPKGIVLGVGSTGRAGMVWPVAASALPSSGIWNPQAEDTGNIDGYAIPTVSDTFRTALSIAAPSTSVQISQWAIQGTAA